MEWEQRETESPGEKEVSSGGLFGVRLPEGVLARAAACAVELRRELHRWPETGNQEFKTAERIERELSELGIPWRRVLDTGIVGVIENRGGQASETAGADLSEGQDGRAAGCVALRADIDALPVQETLRLSFASERPGLMHACGHDVHTAVLLGTARALLLCRDLWRGAVTLIFQPAEETSGGALRMIRAGCLGGEKGSWAAPFFIPRADFVFGLHVKPELPGGTVGIRYGVVHAASDGFRISVRGQKAHGASPHQGIDALVAAAQVVMNLQTVVSRRWDPVDGAVVSIGKIRGGTAPNVLADLVELEGTLRCLPGGRSAGSGKEAPALRALLRDRVEEAARSAAAAAGGQAEVNWDSGYAALVNGNAGCRLVQEAAWEALGKEQVRLLDRPSMGVEDFAYYLQERPGAFFFLGSGFPGRENPGLHSGEFHVNEECISAGIAVEGALVLRLLGL
ncbi:MAG: M20 family metallopeptidase [Bacillota bacterium]|nr:M20 family metallopeptidase [Bacillota bacterium]